MTPEENKRRAEDANVQFIKERICDKDGQKPFVFISYKSDDWEIVLHEAVYCLVKDHGLNVYFDGSFDSHNDLWVKQFPKNMESALCRGVLAFIDDKYATSYATLLELMYSQVRCKDDGLHFVKKKVVPINLSKLSKIKDEASDTGLGKDCYEDGKKNIHAKDEQEEFDKTFRRACKEDILDRSVDSYKPKGTLSKLACSVMVEEVLRSIDANDNYYNNNKAFYKNIVQKIKEVCGEEVFSPDLNKDGNESDNQFNRGSKHVQSAEASLDFSDDEGITLTKEINRTDAQYKICTLGAKCSIGCGELVTVQYGDKTYEGKMHSTCKGRIDRMSRFYSENGIREGDSFRVKCLPDQNRLVFVRLFHEDS